MPEAARDHWNRVYTERDDSHVSWFQADPALSLRLIEEAAPDRSARILDAGAGRSALAGRLVEAGYHSVTVVDVAESALVELRERLGPAGAHVRWVVADLLEVRDLGEFDVWHDRAVFHFMTSPGDRERYLGLIRRSVAAGGHLILATFAPQGPDTCSGLPVCRYDAATLASAVGEGFTLVRSEQEAHHTPWGQVQPFTYAVFQRVNAPPA